MSKDSNPNGGNPYLINSYGKTPSRLNKNWLTNTATTNNPQYNPSSHNQRPPYTAKQTQKQGSLMSTNLSDLSPSVLFQDIGGQKLPKPQEAEREKKSKEEEYQKPVQLGLIGNAFMGATTKYQKLDNENFVSTPNKKSEDQSPIKNSETSSQASVNKFERKRQVQPNAAIIHHNTQQQSGTTPKTDRSNIEGGNRILRKSERGKTLKFMHKKSKEGQNIPIQQHEQLAKHEPEQSKLTKETSSHLTQKVEIQPPSKGYRPIQRNYPSNRFQITQEKSQSNKNIPLEEKSIIKPRETQQKLTELTQKVQQTPPRQPGNVKKPGPISRKPYLNRNTVQTEPNQQEENKTEENTKQSEIQSQSQIAQKIKLKPSIAILYIIKRLVALKQSNSLSILRYFTHRHKKYLAYEASILINSSRTIVHHKQLNLIRIAFDQLRKKLIAIQAQESKSLVKKVLPKPNNIVTHILEHLFKRTLRKGFNQLNTKRLVCQKIKPFEGLSQLLRMKEKSYLKEGMTNIQRKGKQKWYILNSLSNIFTSIMKQQKENCLEKILTYTKEDSSMPIQTNINHTYQGNIVSKPRTVPIQDVITQSKVDNELVQKSQKLKTISVSLTDNLAILQKDVSSAKEAKSKAEEEIKVKIDIERRHNEELKKELGAKKKLKDRLSKDISAVPNNVVESQKLEDQLQPTSDKLLLLTNIYISYCRTLEEPFNSEDLVANYNIEHTNTNSLVNQWNLFLENQQLQKEIDRYEAIKLAESKARKVVLGEQEMVLKLVRNYVREQYFWQWLHASVQIV